MRGLFGLAGLLAAVVAGGLFGALHNQVSYTVAPEYFTAFKFHQFQVAPALRGRMGAAIVGVGASWWMGLLIGIPVSLASMRHRPARAQARAIGRGVFAALACASLGSLTGLLLAFAGVVGLHVDPAGYYEPLLDPIRFGRAGAMHNGAYLGGAVGLLLAPVRAFRDRSASPPPE